MERAGFSSEEDIAAGAEAFAASGDTTSSRVEQAVQVGEPLVDTDVAHVRLFRKPDTLLYQVFRGGEIPEKFWGTGEYGLVLLRQAETYWPVDKPKVEFHPDVCRPEVQADDPTENSMFPPHYYGAYLVVVQGINRKFLLSDARIKGMASDLVEELRKSVASWSNGS